MLRAVVLTQYRRVTDSRTDGRMDGQTDVIAVANTAFAMPALRRAVKRRQLERWQLTCQFSTDGFPTLCIYDRGNAT